MSLQRPPMLALLRYNLKIVAPTLLWTGLLVGLLCGLVLFVQYRAPDRFDAVTAGTLAEQLVPLVAAFFSAGVLDGEMRRGAHELLRARRQPLWRTVAWRLAIALGLALALGAALLALLHFTLRRIPVGPLLLAAAPSALCMALLALWMRVRLGNAFIGHVAALAVWLAGTITGLLGSELGIAVNPLLTLTSYTERLQAAARGELETTPYADWWWVSKLALLAVSMGIFVGVLRRVEHLVEGD